jgi:hypothetical protein
MRSVTANVKANVQGVLSATMTISVLFTSEALRNDMKWPFVTLSSFEVYVEHTSARSSAEAVVVCPFVTRDNIQRWPNYATNHQGWIAEGFQIHENSHNVTVDPIVPIVYHVEISDVGGRKEFVNDLDSCCDDHYPIMPIWQISPPPTASQIVNYNLMAVQPYKYIYDALMHRRGPVLGLAGPNQLNNAGSIEKKTGETRRLDYTEQSYLQATAAADGHVASEELSGMATDFPHSALAYPIFEKPQDKNSTIVGLIFSIIPWDSYIRSVLPAGISGFYCVLHNSCGQAYTFVMRGPHVVLLGEGDMHDPSYDLYKIEMDVAQMWGMEHEVASLGVCLYQMTFYPSDELRQLTQNKTPQMFALLVALSFVIMGGTFIAYDCFVIRKNNKIIHAAAQSNAILSVCTLIHTPLTSTTSSF